MKKPNKTLDVFSENQKQMIAKTKSQFFDSDRYCTSSAPLIQHDFTL